MSFNITYRWNRRRASSRGERLDKEGVAHRATPSNARIILGYASLNVMEEMPPTVSGFWIASALT